MRHSACAALAILLAAPVAAQVAAQEKTAPAPAHTKIEGMPPIPQSIVDGVARYSQYRAARFLAWHPTKRQVVISTSFNANPSIYQAHLVDGPGRDRHQLTWLDRGLSIDRIAFAPGNPDSFVFLYSPSPDLRSLYRYSFATGQVSLVAEAKARYFPAWSRDGKWLAYGSAERNGRDVDVYVIQPSDPTTKRRIAEFTGAWSVHDWSPDGTSILASEIVSNGETYIWKIDVKTGAKTAITPRDGEKAAFFNSRFSPDGRKVYVLSDRAGGEFRIWRCDVAKCVWSAVTPAGVLLDGDSDGGNFELSSDGSLLATVADKGSTSELLVVDLTTLKARSLPPGIPRGVVTRVNWRPNSREVAFTLESSKIPSDVFSLDTSIGTLTRWTTSEMALNPDAMPAPDLIQWKSADGVQVSGILYRPATKFTGPRPVVISLHGGPDAREREIWRGRSNYIFEELGAAVIYPNVRGSTGFGRDYTQLDDGRKRGDTVKDIGALLDWIAARPDLDKNRVVLVGVSSGGWLALQSGIAYSDRIRGVIEGAGITNFVTFLEGTDPVRVEGRRREYGDERDPAMREFLQSLSPALQAAKLRKPTFIIQPGNDQKVPVSQARELYDALKGTNTPVWYLEFTDATHENLPGVGGDYMLASWMWFFTNFLLN